MAISGPGFALNLVGTTPQGQPLPLTSGGALVLDQESRVNVSGLGFQPGRDVYVWIFSEPKLLGTVRVNDRGEFEGSLPIPRDLGAGRRTLQVNGPALNGQVRSLSLGIQVEAVANRVRTGQRGVKTTVSFGPASAELTRGAKSSLRKLVARARGKQIKQARVEGKTFLEAVESARDLARERVAATTAELRKLGVKQKIQKRVVPTKKINDRQASRYEVTLRIGKTAAHVSPSDKNARASGCFL